MLHLGTCGALAAVCTVSAESTQGLGGSAGPDLTRYFVVCGGLLALVALLAFGFRRLIGRTLAVRAARRSLQVVDMLPLGGKQRLAVVRCYDRTFLIGLGDKEVSGLAELDAAVLPERELAPTKADLHGFARVLDRIRRPVRAAGSLDEGVLG
jgi:flagellar biogenesis protein FliO